MHLKRFIGSGALLLDLSGPGSGLGLDLSVVVLYSSDVTSVSLPGGPVRGWLIGRVGEDPLEQTEEVCWSCPFCSFELGVLGLVI